MPAWDANVASERTGRIGPDLDLASSTVAATTTPTPVRSTGMRSDACTSGPGLPGCRLVDGLSPKIRRPVGPPHLWLTALPGPGRDAQLAINVTCAAFSGPLASSPRSMVQTSASGR